MIIERAEPSAAPGGEAVLEVGTRRGWRKLLARIAGPGLVPPLRGFEASSKGLSWPQQRPAGQRLTARPKVDSFAPVSPA